MGRESCFYFSLEDKVLDSAIDSELEKQSNIPIKTERYWKAVEAVLKNPDEIYK